MIAVLALGLSLNAVAGPSSGGGGTQEAQVFTQSALKAIVALQYNPKYKRYTDQLMETLSTLEVYPVDTLEGVCDNSVKSPNLYAYSCSGRVYLLNYYWGFYQVYGPRTDQYGLQWLIDPEHHWVEIFHELFRAGNPQSHLYVTNDPGNSISNLLAVDELLDSYGNGDGDCDLSFLDCNRPFGEPVIEKNYSCEPYDNGDAELYLELLGANGKNLSIHVGGRFSTKECEQEAKLLQRIPLASLAGNFYFCSSYYPADKAELYIQILRPDFSYFQRKLKSYEHGRDCLAEAERKTREARGL